MIKRKKQETTTEGLESWIKDVILSEGFQSALAECEANIGEIRRWRRAHYPELAARYEEGSWREAAVARQRELRRQKKEVERSRLPRAPDDPWRPSWGSTP